MNTSIQEDYEQVLSAIQIAADSDAISLCRDMYIVFKYRNKGKFGYEHMCKDIAGYLLKKESANRIGESMSQFRNDLSTIFNFIEYINRNTFEDLTLTKDNFISQANSCKELLPKISEHLASIENLLKQIQ